MKKRFNITGLCIKEMHYMVDISDKVNKIIEMIDYGDYFTINRPRQFGKTTILNTLRLALSDKYLVIDTSFEGMGNDLFDSEEKFCSRILERFAKTMRITDKTLSALLMKYHERGIRNFNELSDAITEFIEESNKEVVLLIDEVDKSSNSKVFLQFLGLLRNKYLARNAGKDITFKSVVLAGVHDIKNLKLAIRDESDTRFNSPWNISAKFDIDMSFNAEEIESMLMEYQEENNVSFDYKGISELIYMFTSGYPYLVSDICKIIDEKLDAVWILDNVYLAVKMLLNEKNTLFEDVIINIENNEDIKKVVNELLLLGRNINYNPYSYEKGIMYGIFKENDHKLVVHNMIFEELIYNYMIEQDHIRKMSVYISNEEQSKFLRDGKLDLEQILIKFQQFMIEEYRKEDEKFYESQARLIFLSYLKPILNGKGFYFVEPQTRENKRFDIVIIWGSEKYVIELKLWNGEKYGMVKNIRKKAGSS